MHMADALVSPAVGGTMWAATAALTVYSAKKLKEDVDERRVPLMGVLGAFIFAAQMINFTIPGTGSSGHLGGGMILTILLGPHAAFLTMASILTVQALFFADGGLVALGCNIFNLGFFPCFVAYPLVYKTLVKDGTSRRRIMAGSIAASLFGLQLGAFGVVLQTVFSGISELPFKTFVLMMLPIHLAIGLVEGIVTAAVVSFIHKARPEILEMASAGKSLNGLSFRNVLVPLLIATFITGGVLSWFASSNPDGLEWSMFHTAGKEELENPTNSVHAALGDIQEKTALMPDYGFKVQEEEGKGEEEPWPAVKAGTSLSGILGGTITMLLAALIGFSLNRYRSKQNSMRAR